MILKSVAFENFFQIQLKLYWKDVQIWCRWDSAIFILNPTSNWIWGLISRINFKYKLFCEIDEDVIKTNYDQAVSNLCQHYPFLQSMTNMYSPLQTLSFRFLLSRQVENNYSQWNQWSILMYFIYEGLNMFFPVICLTKIVKKIPKVRSFKSLSDS